MERRPFSVVDGNFGGSDVKLMPETLIQSSGDVESPISAVRVTLTRFSQGAVNGRSPCGFHEGQP